MEATAPSVHPLSAIFAQYHAAPPRRLLQSNERIKLYKELQRVRTDGETRASQLRSTGEYGMAKEIERETARTLQNISDTLFAPSWSRMQLPGQGPSAQMRSKHHAKVKSSIDDLSDAFQAWKVHDKRISADDELIASLANLKFTPGGTRRFRSFRN